MDELVFSNARLVLDTEIVSGSLRVVEGRIVAIDPTPCALPGAVDVEGDYLLPGLVELHTDSLERHLSPRPTVEWPIVPALASHDTQLVAAGITTVLDALRIGDFQDTDVRAKLVLKTMRSIDRARTQGWLRADHHLHIRCELGADDVLPTFERCLEASSVRLVSVMDHTPGQRQFRDIEKWKTYCRGKYELSETQIEADIGLRQNMAACYVAGNRRRIVALARGLGLKLASHDDTTLAHIEEAAEQGITIAEFPTTLEAAAAAHWHGMSTVAGAPNVVRGGSHSGNVSALELMRGGHLDALSSDYVPVSLLHAAFLLDREDGVTLPAAVAMVSRNPARMVGLDDRGEIAVGKRADLIRVHTEHGPPLVRTVWREGERVM